MKKIACFSNQFASSKGHGIARYATHLFNELNSLNKNIEIIPIATGSNRNIEDLKKLKSETGLQILPGGTMLTPLLWKYMNYPKIEHLANCEFDILHALSPGYPIATKKPYLVTIHDIGPLTHPQFFTRKDQWLMKASIKQALKKAAYMLCVSEATANAVEIYAKQTYGLSVGNRLKITYEGVGNEFFTKVDFEEIPLDERNKIKNLSNKPYILCVGQISPRKNVQSVLESFSIIKDKLHDYQLVTVGGNGWDYDIIKHKINELDISDRVHFLGYVSDQSLRYLYENATVFIYPSLFEGFGLTILEAMATGCPVITSNKTSMPEILGRAGILIDPENIHEISESLLETCTNDFLRSDLKRKGILRAKEFTWNNCASKTLEVYKLL